MEKLKMFSDFEKLLSEKFPNRFRPIKREVTKIYAKSFDDARFVNWRKKK